jgi:hypothetical protein
LHDGIIEMSELARAEKSAAGFFVCAGESSCQRLRGTSTLIGSGFVTINPSDKEDITSRARALPPPASIDNCRCVHNLLNSLIRTSDDQQHAQQIKLRHLNSDDDRLMMKSAKRSSATDSIQPSY